MIVVPGPASLTLGRTVAELLKSRIIPVVFKSFPDGESYIRLDGKVDDDEVVIIQTTGPPQDLNMIRLLLLVDAAKNLGAKKVTVVAPYLAYTRQDKRFLPGEAISIATLIKCIETVETDLFITVNIHEETILKKFKIPTKNLSAIPLLAKHFKKKGLKDMFSVAPDFGAIGLAKEADAILGGGYGWLRKKRDRFTGEICLEKKRFDVEGRDVIVFDDIISTGGTIATAIKLLKAQGAQRVYASCVHPLLVNGAQKKIMKAGAEDIVGTNCVPTSINVVSVAPIIADAVSKGSRSD